MSLATVRRLAADILGVGQNRIRMKPDEIAKIKEALTRGDVESLINEKVITVSPIKGRRKHIKRKRKGIGKRKGVSRGTNKEDWMKQVRSQRRYLRQLLSEGKIDRKNKRVVYRKIKSGTFRSKATMLVYLKENGLYKEGEVK